MTLVLHRLITPDGAPIVGQRATALLMVRDDITHDSYSVNVPEGGSFTGQVRTRTVSTSDADGWLEWELAPNEYIYPGGTYYQVQGLGRRTILWVFDSADPVELTECRLDLVDFTSSNLVIVQGPRGKSGEDGVADAISDASIAALLDDPDSATRQKVDEIPPGPHTHPSAQITDFTSAVRDAAAQVFGAGSNVTLTAGAQPGTYLINAVSSGSSTTDAEAVRDAIGAALIPGAHVQIIVDDNGNLITIGVSLTEVEAIVFHDGTPGGGTRPSGYARVRWVGGTTRPTNMLTGDIWEHDV